MTQVDFNVEALHEVTLDGGAELQGVDLMSPYVWRLKQGGLGILVRVVPRAPSAEGHTGTIWYGESKDGLRFKMGDTPVLAPERGPDCGGCEDPTLVEWDDKLVVYYTGVDHSRRSGQMLYAVGKDIYHLEKQGEVLASLHTEGNTKEATIERTADGLWRMFYEYARDDASLVGLAMGEGVAGPWHEKPAPFKPRKDSWDNWHLSTGPLWTKDPDMPVMFYNGATRDARWRIGWIAFDRDFTKAVDRCIEPLIVPPPPEDRAATDIAFASSVVEHDGRAHLYFSRADNALFRAVVRKAR